MEGWRDRISEIKSGSFQVCLTQGINIRMITPEAAAALASIEYRDSRFDRRRLYTAWDNLGDESRFFAGLDMLNQAGIPNRRIMVYMLIGYAKGETMSSILYRFGRLAGVGVLPYPMVYDNSRVELKRFQRWVIRGFYNWLPFEEYRKKAITGGNVFQGKLYGA